MAGINIFKKEKEVKEKEVTEKKETVKKESRVVSNSGAWNVLQSPCITEKAVNMSSYGNFYVFHISTDANKVQVKKAVEEKYKVEVTQVRTISIPRKKFVRGKIEGWKPGYRKAIVKVKEGQKIEIIAQ